ncbi:hypothetical protein YC2023_032939 [Brassica napus]
MGGVWHPEFHACDKPIIDYEVPKIFIRPTMEFRRLQLFSLKPKLIIATLTRYYLLEEHVLSTLKPNT